MLVSRRYLPSTNLLSSFEAAARLQSFTAAAKELHLTQSAVSRHIKALEEQVGVILFERVRQKIHLTPAGESYARTIREALQAISNATMILQVNPRGGTLDLAILPTFGTRWLAPRLSGFLSENPGVTINFSTRLRSFDFDREPFDAAIHFGQPDWPDTKAAFLMNETVLPTCSAEFKSRHPYREAAQLCSGPLLHLSSRPDAWAHWFASQDIPYQGREGMMFDQFATAAQAAKHGLGVALLPEFLIERELADGDLVPALEIRIQSAEAYYLIWPKQKDNDPALISFRDWIIAATGK